MNQLINGLEADLVGSRCPSNTIKFLENLPIDLIQILNKIATNNGGVWIVGGAVRDWLIGHTPEDIDLAVSFTPEQMLELFPDAILTGEDFGTISLRGENCVYQATTLRSDGTYLDGRRPENVFWGSSLKEDLERRDFTINAMAIDASRVLLYDPHNGRNDISRGIIRAVGNAYQRLSEDGLRIMRAYRFSDRKDKGVWELENSLEVSISQLKHMLDNISRERILIEWKKILSGQNSSHIIQKMALMGVLDRFLIGKWDEKFSIFEALKKDLSIFSGLEKFALMLSENTNQEVVFICKELKMSKVERNHVVSIHKRFGHIPELNKQSIRKFRYILQDFTIKHLTFEKIIIDSKISIEGINKPKYDNIVIEEILESLERIEKQKTQDEPLADGNWIMIQTGLPKGEKLGRLKSWLHTIQIERDLVNLSQIEKVLSTLSWNNDDFKNWPELKFP